MFEFIKDTVNNKVSKNMFPKKLYTIERIDFRLHKPIKANDSNISIISLTNLDYLSSEVFIFSDKRDVEEFKKELIPNQPYDNITYSITQPDKYGMYAIILISHDILHHFVFATSEMEPENDSKETDTITNNMIKIET